MPVRLPAIGPTGGAGDERQTDFAREAFDDDQGNRQHQAGEREAGSKPGQGGGPRLFGQAGKRRRMSSDTEQQCGHNRYHRCLYATRKRQRRDRCGAEVERDGNEVGDRNH